MAYIKFDNISFKYKGTDMYSLHNLNLQIEKGQCVLIAGKSGHGKTTLTRIINGLIPHFYEGELKGRAVVDREEIRDIKSYEFAKKVNSVFQDPRSQFFTTDTISEVAFGLENLAVTSDDIHKRVIEVFNELNINHLKNKSIFELSSGEKQKIAIASIVAINPDIYVLDEPSSNLDVKSANEFAKILKHLKKKGKTIIVSDHRYQYIDGLFDRVIYLSEGRIKFDYKTQDLKTFDEEHYKKLGLRVVDEFRSSEHQIRNFTGSKVIDIEDLTVSYKKHMLLENISLSTYPSEIIGIVGENGVGKTSLAKTICGLIKEKTGSLYIAGRKIKYNKRPSKSYFIMQDVDYQLFTESVEEELKLGNEKTDDLDSRIDQILKGLNIAEYKEHHPMVLSGGQKQRVTIGAGMIKDCDVVFFDEPTSGLDGNNMERISEMIKTFGLNNKTVFVISHDYDFMQKTCTRILHLGKKQLLSDFRITCRKDAERLKAIMFEEGEFICNNH